MIAFSDQLSQDNWYITLSTKILVNYIISYQLTIISFGL